MFRVPDILCEYISIFLQPFGCAMRFMKPLPVFQTEICEFPHPILDLTLKLILVFRVAKCLSYFILRIRTVFRETKSNFRPKCRNLYPIPCCTYTGLIKKSMEQTEFLTKENLHSHGYVHFPLKNNNVCSDEGLMLETSATHQTQKTKWRP